MDVLIAHPFAAAAGGAIIISLVGWRVVRAGFRAVRAVITGLWPH